MGYYFNADFERRLIDIYCSRVRETPIRVLQSARSTFLVDQKVSCNSRTRKTK